ncbi:hypothetical protein EYF80_043377 [Liparis tanakae]|uniref:Uncharacterized protein n=1 Tax=Liparis tanakae TaxID=230148 RepID=A0A4Z2FZJ8_9TELE|nr:hypothetical protein EYF80_043377 [Liparis tanakae]
MSGPLERTGSCFLQWDTSGVTGSVTSLEPRWLPDVEDFLKDDGKTLETRFWLQIQMFDHLGLTRDRIAHTTANSGRIDACRGLISVPRRTRPTATYRTERHPASSLPRPSEKFPKLRAAVKRYQRFLCEAIVTILK